MIKTTIDRISISIPIVHAEQLLARIGTTCTLTNEYNDDEEGYWYKKYLNRDNRLTIKGKLYEPGTENKYSRLYLSLYDPDHNIQKYLKSVLSWIYGNNYKGRNSPTVQQVEATFDFFANDEDDLQDIQEFIEHHCFLRYSRSDACNQIESTLYTGCRGDIRQGSKGIRCYIKREHGNTFYRMEFQLNRSFLLKHNITFNSLPLNPLQFQLFDFIDILEDFSETGIKNIVIAILKKKGITESGTPDFNLHYHKLVADIRSTVVGADKRKKKYSVPSQIAVLKDIRNEHTITFNHKRYFQSMDSTKQLIVCHADIGCEEENTSKHLMFCQGI